MSKQPKPSKALFHVICIATIYVAMFVGAVFQLLILLDVI